jgi:hypothetical protein
MSCAIAGLVDTTQAETIAEATPAAFQHLERVSLSRFRNGDIVINLSFIGTE